MKHTPLYKQHVSSNAKIVEFAGYAMPIQYSEGIKNEHLWVRSHAGIFDVSHMGQALLTGSGLSDFFGHITPSGFKTLAEGKAKYTVLTNEDGGIIDDFIVTKLSEELFFIVFNAACKEKDIAWITSHLPSNITFKELDNRALIAVQGPKAQASLSSILGTDLSNQAYMSLQQVSYQNEVLYVSRLGYTGEDGFEVSIPSTIAGTFWEALETLDDVKPIGLGARDSLRLEVGYPLYGHDLDDTTSPVEANLSWLIRKQNHDFIGHERISSELNNTPKRLRVGIKLLEKGIAREGAEIFNESNEKIGTLSSGSFGPSINGPIAQGYIPHRYATKNTPIFILVRGKMLKATVHDLNFVETSTKK